MGIKTVQFIAEIKKRPCLWNNTLENYSSNKLGKQQAWNEVAEIMFEHWSTRDATFRTEKLREIQKKWKGLRDYFARTKNNLPKNKDETDRRKRRKAPSLKMLQFLNITKPDDGVPPEPESEDSDSSFSSSRAKSRQIQVNIETEQLITEVHNKPCLWNFNLPEYNDKDVKHQAWLEIAVGLYEDFSSLSERNKREIIRHMQKKWKGLRDYFTRQKTKERATKGERPLRKRKAPFLAMLQFLDIPKLTDDESQDCSKTGNISEQNDSMPQDADSDVSQSSFTWSGQNTSTSKPKNIHHRSSKEGKIKHKRSDPDMNFLLNILPDMKSMTQRQNFDFRFEVMKLIKNIKYSQPNEYFCGNEGSSGNGQEVPVQMSWHTSKISSKTSGKPPFRHQVIIHEYPRNRDGDDQTPLSHDSRGSSVDDIKMILQGSSEEQSD